MEEIFRESLGFMEKGDFFRAYIQIERLFSSSPKNPFIFQLIENTAIYEVYSLQIFAVFNQTEITLQKQPYIDFLLQNANYFQLRVCLKDFYKFIKSYTDFLEEKKIVLKGLKGVAASIEGLQKIDIGITPIHVFFCKMSINSRQYRFGAQVCSKVTLGTSKELLTSAKYVHSYAFYAAIIFTA